MTRHNGTATMTMRGPETKATPLLCAVQAEWAGISFTPGSFLPHVLASDLVDGAVDLPTAIGGGIHASAHHGDYARR